MREILFRAKRKNWRDLSKEEWWVEGYYCYFMNEHCILPKNLDVDAALFGEQKVFVIIDPETLCQYTGKPDEDGKKIFEGDIVGFIDLYSTESGYSESSCLGEVIWGEEECCFHVTNRLSAESWEVLDECKVVGNVFDDKEILEDF